jgi:DNA-binding ferritin-like protein
LAVDEIAERIRAIGARAPGSYSEFAEFHSRTTGNLFGPPVIEAVWAH